MVLNIRKSNFKISFLLITLAIGCTTINQDDIYGKYAARGYRNNFDTIELKPNNTYTRKIYDKNNKLLLNSTHPFEFVKPEKIQFWYFIDNYDEDYSMYPQNLYDTLGGVQCVLERKGNSIFFSTDVYINSGKYCYYKLKEKGSK
jgi:hypothetical protein